MSEADQVSLDIMIEALDRIAVYIAGFDVDRFENDQRTVDAVALNLLVTGEMSLRLSPELKAQSDAPWPKIAGLRHHIAHGYFSLSARRLWETASLSAPELRALVRRWSGR